MTWDRHAADQLREALEGVGPVPASPGARDATLAAIDAALSQSPQRASRRAPRWALAAAALLAVGAATSLLSRPAPAARIVGSTGDVEQRAAGAFHTRQGTLTLALASGATLTLAPQTDVEVKDDGARVLLRAGAVAAMMLSGEQQSITVETLDSQVFTRGARMKIDTRGGCDGSTGITVDEGAVLVRRRGTETPVMTGQTWPSCPTAPSTAPMEAPTPAPTLQRGDAPPAPRPESALTKQNRHYERAMALQREGQFDGALRELEQVIAGPDTSPLAEPALALKLRWLAPSRPVEARAAARQYLQRFPMGPARADAEVLLLDP